MNDDDNIRTCIDEGDAVVDTHDRRFQGTAFIKNKKDQWLVYWLPVWIDGKTYGGRMDIVHQNNLKRL